MRGLVIYREARPRDRCQLGLHVAVTTDRHALALDRGTTERANDLVRHLLRHLDEREAVRDLDRADGARAHVRFVRDGTDEVPGSDARLSARTDVHARHVPLLRPAPATSTSRRPLAPFASSRAIVSR